MGIVMFGLLGSLVTMEMRVLVTILCNHTETKVSIPHPPSLSITIAIVMTISAGL